MKVVYNQDPEHSPVYKEINELIKQDNIRHIEMTLDEWDELLDVDLANCSEPFIGPKNYKGFTIVVV
jgi:hypothetical protein